MSCEIQVNERSASRQEADSGRVGNSPAPPTQASLRCEVTPDGHSTPSPTYRQLSPPNLVHSPGGSKQLGELHPPTPLDRVIVEWINYQLRDQDKQLVDLHTDLRDGSLLLSLVAKLTKKQITSPDYDSFPISHSQCLENVQLALSKFKDNGLRLVHDSKSAEKLVDGNFSFTVEFCKSVIQHYHFTFGSHPDFMLNSQKKRLLLLLQAALPNASPDLKPSFWMDGRLFSSLLAYCKPDLYATNQISEITALAHTHLGIPPLLQHGDLTSSSREFILLTYLFFFVRPGSPVQENLLKWINSLPPWKNSPAGDFDKDWEDGRWIYKIVYSLIPNSLPSLVSMTGRSSAELINSAVEAAEKNLSITSDFSSADIGNPTADPFPLILFLIRLQSVKNIPCRPHPASKIVLSKDLKKLQRIGSRVSIQVDQLESPGCEIQVMVHGPPSLKEPLPLERVSDTTEQGLSDYFFYPTSVGDFSIAIRCNDVDIPDSPLDFHVFDPQQCRLVTSLEENYLLGQEVSFKVCTTQAGQGELTAHLSTPPLPMATQSPQTESLQVCSVEKLESGIFRVYFTPQIEGIHRVSLFFNDHSIPNFQPPLEFSCKRLLIDLPTRSPANATAVLKIKSQDHVDVTVTSPRGEMVDVRKDSRDSFSYTPPEPGKYIITARLADQTIEGFPIDLTHFDASLAQHCRVLGLHDSASSLVNYPVQFTVDCSAAGNGSLTVQVHPPSGNTTIEAKLEKMDEDGCYAVSFTPKFVGKHLLSICWNDFPIPHAPHSILISDPSRWSLQGCGLRWAVVGPAENEFDIITNESCDLHPRDRDLSVQVILCPHNSQHTIEQSLERLGGDMTAYRCNYQIVPNPCSECPYCDCKDAAVSDHVQIDVKFKTWHVSGSPYKVKVSSGPASQCFIREKPESHLIIDQPIIITLDATNLPNDVRKEDFNIKVYNNSDKLVSDIQVQLIPEEKNTFSIDFVPREKGTYRMDIDYKGKPIPDSGTEFQVRYPVIQHHVDRHPPPDGNTTTSPFIRPQFDSNLMTDQPISVTLDAKDIDPHNTIVVEDFSVEVRNSSGEAVSMQMKPDAEEKNVFSITFVPRKKDKYVMTIKYKDAIIPDREFEVTEALPGSPYNNKVIVIPEQKKAYIPNRPILVTLDAKEADLDNDIPLTDFDIRVYDCSGGIELPKVCPKKGERNIFSVTFVPKEEGTYTMYIAYKGAPTPDNGTKFEVKYPQQGQSPTEYYAHHPISIVVQSDHLAPPPLEAVVTSPTKKQVPCKVHKVNTRTHRIDFTPDDEGTFDVDLSYGEVRQTLQPTIHLPNSKLTARDAPHDGTHCIVEVDLKAEGALLKGFKSVSLPDSIETATAARPINEKFAVRAVGKETGTELTHPAHVQFTQKGEGEFLINVRTTVPDVYQLTVEYCGKPLPDCPFTLDMTSIPNVEKVISYDFMIPFRAGNPIEMFFDTSEAGKTSCKDFTVTVFSTATRKIVSHSIEEESSDLFKVSFVPTQDDDFEVEVHWYGLAIKDSPFSLSFKQQLKRPPVTISFDPLAGPRTIVTASLQEIEEQGSDNQKDGGSVDAEEDNESHHTQSTNAHSIHDRLPPRPALQQYERGRYQISLWGHRRGKYLVRVYSFGHEIKGSPFKLDTSGPPTHPPQVEGLESLKYGHYGIARRVYYGILSAKVNVHGKKSSPVPIAFTVTPEMATINFDDKDREIYDLRLYWNYVQFKGAPFLLTKHHESACKARKKKKN